MRRRGARTLLIGAPLVLAGSLLAPQARAQDWSLQAGDARGALLHAERSAADAGLAPSLRQEKEEAMAESSFHFLRGTSRLFHRDLLETGLLDGHCPPDLVSWLQGDAHVGNVGVLDEKPFTAEPRVIFDLDDFDQAWIGCYRVDVLRLAASLQVFAAEAGVAEAGAAVEAFAGEYLRQVLAFAGTDDEVSFRLDRDVAEGPARRLILETLEEEGPGVMASEWTRGRGERRRFRSTSDLESIPGEVRAELEAAVASYAAALEGFGPGYFRVLDAARRLHAGVGSLGVERFYVLVEGPEGAVDVILDFKAQEKTPSLARLFPDFEPAATGGCRTARAERALLGGGDSHLGCLELGGRSFSVRLRNPYKKSIKAKKIEGRGDLGQLAVQLGRVLAAAHARSDHDAEASGLDSSFDDAFAARFAEDATSRDFVVDVAAFAASYARQIEADFELFRRHLRRH